MAYDVKWVKLNSFNETKHVHELNKHFKNPAFAEHVLDNKVQLPNSQALV